MTEMAPEQIVPDNIGEPVDVEVDFEPTDDGITIEARLGEATITVDHSWSAAEQVAILVHSLPNILMAVQTALNEQEAIDHG